MHSSPSIRFARVCVSAVCFLCLTGLVMLGNSVSFDYDAAGRLTKAGFTGNKSIAYTYDNAGNLRQRQITVGSGGPDSDGDGMDDAWENQYFSNLSRTGAGDFDNDGSSDLSEFLAGTVPTNSASALRVFGNPAPGSGGTMVEWASVSGRAYRLQFKYPIAVANWSNVPGDVTASGPVASKLDASATGQALRFYRVMLVP